MNYYSLKKIIASLPAKKNSKSSFWVKLIVRKLSFLFTWLFINIGCSAWSVSVLSVFVAFAGSILLCIDGSIYRGIGITFVEFWLILDCVDGNIARVQKKSSLYGEFVDALSGYYITGLVFIGLGVAAYNTKSTISVLPHYFYIIAGAFSSIFGLLTRIIHQKFTYTNLMIYGISNNSEKKEMENKRSVQYLRSRIDKELGISGLFMPLLLVCYIYNIYDWVTLGYLFFHFIGLIAATVYYSIKARI